MVSVLDQKGPAGLPARRGEWLSGNLVLDAMIVIAWFGRQMA
jgi:hypothetical protein